MLREKTSAERRPLGFFGVGDQVNWKYNGRLFTGVITKIQPVGPKSKYIIDTPIEVAPDIGDEWETLWLYDGDEDQFLVDSFEVSR